MHCQLIVRLFVCFVLLPALLASEQERAVVRVNGQPITMSDLTHELLRREGVDQLEKAVSSLLADIDWSAIDADEEVLRVRGRGVTKRRLADELLREHGAKVRREMISIAIVRQALAAEGLVVTQRLLEREMERQRQRFESRTRVEGQPRVLFEDWLSVHKGRSIEQYMQEDGFAMAAGLHELVHRRTTVGEGELRRHYAEHFERRFAKPERVDMSILYIPFRTLPGADGAREVDAEHRESLALVMQQLHRDIAAERVPFVRAWALYAQPYDPDADQGRVLGVPRSGWRGEGMRRIPEAVVSRAFELPASRLPVLLEPITHQEGMELVRVEARHPAQRPSFEEIRDQVRADFIETHLERLTQGLMTRLRAAARIDYEHEWSELLGGE